LSFSIYAQASLFYHLHLSSTYELLCRNEIQQLEEENRLMEERLRLMREMMSLEKQKREASNKSTWSSRIAKQDTKKQESKQIPNKSPSQNSLSLSPSTKQLLPKTSSSTTTKPKLSSSTSSSTSPPTKDKARTDQTEINGGGFDEETSHQSFLEALDEWRQGGESTKPTPKKSLASSTSSTSTSSLSSSSSTSSLSTKPNGKASHEQESSGMAKGGEFNEEESHQSFLDALEDWRNSGKPAHTAAQQNTRPSTGIF
jgi:hypothetical protein